MREVEELAIWYWHITKVKERIKIEQREDMASQPWQITGGPLDGQMFDTWDDMIATMEGLI